MPKDVRQTVKQDDIRFINQDFKVQIIPRKTSVSDSVRLFHPEIEIKYFYSGESLLMVGDDNILAMPGDIVVVNPYEIHSTVQVGETPSEYLLLMVDLDFFFAEMASEPNLAHLLLSRRLRIHHLIRNHEMLSGLLKALAKEADLDAPYSHTAVRGLLLAFFALLLRDESENQAPSENREDVEKYYSVIEPALQRIRRDYQSTLTVGALAALCNVSKSHFCRIFKIATGKTAVNYVTDYRLKIAKMWLEHSSDGIAQIASICGFQEEGYFCRRFKQKYKCTPRQSRKKPSEESN